jgi:hypothetical protein
LRLTDWCGSAQAQLFSQVLRGSNSPTPPITPQGGLNLTRPLPLASCLLRLPPSLLCWIGHLFC